MNDNNIIKKGEIDFSNIKTYSVKKRKNLVTIKNMAVPNKNEHEKWGNSCFDQLVEKVIIAIKNGNPVILSMGAHVIKNGLSRYLIEFIKKGFITHIASNGAGSIHDFELAYNGGTSENVPSAIEDGSFGMWEETGKWMNEAIKEGFEKGLGYGESLGVYVENNIQKFPYAQDCVFYQAYKHNVPATYHIAIGTDIIHQHPTVDFAAIGYASGVDFRKFCYSVSKLNGGVFLNFGSGVIGPEVFLKALSISRNLGYKTFDITTANFDLIDLGDYKKKLDYDNPYYYYRPRKNIVNRPVSKGGKGWHFCGEHKVTIPALYDKLISRFEEIKSDG